MEVNYSGMNGVVANALFSMYDNGFIETIGTTLQNVMSSTADIMTNSNWVSIAFSAFSGIIASLVIIYFYLDIMDQMSRDMLSLEKLVMSFSKLVACVAVVICAQDICTLFVQFGEAFLELVQQSLSITTQTKMVVFLPSDKDSFIQAMNVVFPAGGGEARLFSTIGFVLGHPLWTIESLIIEIIAMVIKLVGYFIAISSAIILMARVFFAPIGVLNIYRGENSSGVRYFKQLLASACTFAAMLAIVAAASMVSQALIKNNAFENLGLTDYYTYSVPVTATHSSYTGETVYLGNDGNYYTREELTYDESTGTYIYQNQALLVINLEDYAEEYDTTETIEESGSDLLDICADYKLPIEDATNLWYERNGEKIYINGLEEDVSPGTYYIDINGSTWTVQVTDSEYLYYQPGNDQATYRLENPSLNITSSEDLDEMRGETKSGQKTTIENAISLALSFRMLLWALIPQIAAVGGMAGASRIIHDAFGAGGG